MPKTRVPAPSGLPRRAGRILAAARALAQGRGVRLYLAGGVVRDLLLSRAIRDLDLVVDGDAIEFARRLAARLRASVRTHRRFGTATLSLPGGERLDVAGTRRETYPRPGALPQVSAGGSIEEDLARRDFTFNAMALELFPRRRLFDPFSGRSDLERGLVRTLHRRSFLDDPTRAFRAVRYAHRLGFRIEARTRHAIAEAVRAGAFEGVSGDRIRRELRLILEEPGRARAIRRLHALGLDAAIHPALSREAPPAGRLRLCESLASAHPGNTTCLCYLLAWLSGARVEEARALADRLALAGKDGRRLREWPVVRKRLTPGLAALAPSALASRTEGLSADEIVAAAAGLGAADRRALVRHGGLRPRLRLSIRGADLRAAGVEAGPAIGAALARTLAARQDGRIAAGEELAFALAVARGEAP